MFIKSYSTTNPRVAVLVEAFYDEDRRGFYMSARAFDLERWDPRPTCIYPHLRPESDKYASLMPAPRPTTRAAFVADRIASIGAADLASLCAKKTALQIVGEAAEDSDAFLAFADWH